jgi:UPF0042 nucleotide-binding protein
MSEWAPLDLASARDEIILVTGISGSGKSVALHALEDAGFFCVDNLPPELLRDFIRLEHERFTHRVAVAVDVRTAGSLPHLLPLIDTCAAAGCACAPLFLDASTDALVRRFSETRRPHPCRAARPGGADSAPGADRRHRARARVAGRPARGLHRDRHQPAAPGSAAQLGSAIAGGRTRGRLTLVFESFAFKHGVPLDADFVFDVRVLPNPYYIRELRPLTGRDAPRWPPTSSQQPEVRPMLAQIETFLRQLAAVLRGRPAQLPHRGHRLHRRPAPVGLLRGDAGAALRGPACPRCAATASSMPRVELTRADPLPLFPLQTVLFPGGLLPLKVFEARYLDLVGQCLRSGTPFGVVCLRQGGEVGRAAGACACFETVGVLARWTRSTPNRPAS